MIDITHNHSHIIINIDTNLPINSAMIYHNEGYTTLKKGGTNVSSFFSSSTIEIPFSLLKSDRGFFFIEINNVLHTLPVLDYYDKCILNKLVSLKLDNCSIISCNKEDKEMIFYAYSLLETAKESFYNSFYEEAVTLLKQLDELCTECNNGNNDCGCN